jgi:hypothetical protein
MTLAHYIIIIFWLHFIGDFLFQSRHMANNKSKDNWILATHCLFYCVPLLFLDVWWGLLNGLLHFPVDYITSRTTSKLYTKEQYHWFFTVIGFDQAVHMTLLIMTFVWFFNA